MRGAKSAAVAQKTGSCHNQVKKIVLPPLESDFVRPYLLHHEAGSPAARRSTQK
jgi:hypothetical protein